MNTKNEKIMNTKNEKIMNTKNEKIMNTKNEKKKIFIGSSSEALQHLQDIRKKLENDFEVIAWNDPGVYSLNNQSFLDSLIKQSYLVDFAIFIAASDDITQSRGKEQKSTRDNVIFEFGMFLQSLGKDRCFMLVESDSRVLSDMTGITIKKFSDPISLDHTIHELKNNLLQRKKHIPSLVTTGLAYGYYKNFIKKLAECEKCTALTIHLGRISFNPKEYKKYQSDDFPVRQAFHKSNDCGSFVDYPTTLEVIDDIINDKSELSEDEKERYRKREIGNFQLVIERRMENESFKSKVNFLCS